MRWLLNEFEYYDFIDTCITYKKMSRLEPWEEQKKDIDVKPLSMKKLRQGTSGLHISLEF